MQKGGMTTRDDILQLLRRESLTTPELAERLGLSRNAVVVPLGQLISEGFIKKAALRRSGQAGKPAHEYEILPGHEDRVSSAYRPFTELMLVVLQRCRTKEEIEAIMLDIGREMAASRPISAAASFEDRLKAARAVVDELGAATELLQENGKLLIQSLSCPLAAAVRKEACVCKAIAAFFEAATGKQVKERCLRQEKLTCRFEVV